MAQKNRRFPYIEKMHYHVYNRGRNKKPVFFDNKDYWIFRRIVRERLIENKEGVNCLAFCLLPNHYHFLFYQESERGISGIMKSILIRYSLYLRKKYDLEGGVFGSSYRALHLPSEISVERTKIYIMKNPIEAGCLEWRHVGTKV